MVAIRREVASDTRQLQVDLKVRTKQHADQALLTGALRLELQKREHHISRKLSPLKNLCGEDPGPEHLFLSRSFRNFELDARLCQLISQNRIHHGRRILLRIAAKGFEYQLKRIGGEQKPSALVQNRG